MRVKLAVIVVVLAVLALLARFGPEAPLWPRCPFHVLTGLECPGCGSTRAIHALLRGDLRVAFWCNPFLFYLIPMLTTASLCPRLFPGRTAIWLIAIPTIAWGVARNIV